MKRKTAVRNILSISAFVLATTSHAGIKNELIACTHIKADSERLLCYDKSAEALQSQLSSKTTAADSKKTKEAEQSEKANTGAATSSLASAVQADAQSNIVVSKEDAFGKTAEQINQLDSIKSHIKGPFKGWKKGAVISLANGQKWKVTSRNTGYVNLTDPMVEISRGFLGSFNIKVEGLNARAKVRRVE